MIRINNEFLAWKNKNIVFQYMDNDILLFRLFSHSIQIKSQFPESVFSTAHSKKKSFNSI